MEVEITGGKGPVISESTDLTRLKYEKNGPVAWITINRPEVRNAIDAKCAHELWAAFKMADTDDSVGVIVLTGGAGRAFSAGADFKEMADEQLRAAPNRFPHLGVNFHTSKPTVAAVNGAAFGGGFLLAQMCDLVVAAKTATFGIPEVRWGRGAPWAASLSRIIGPRASMEMLLTGNSMDASRALAVGLVNAVVPPDELSSYVQQLAERIAENAPLSVVAAKALVAHSVEFDVASTRVYAETVYEKVYQSDDALEGPRAFREGRPPNWRGS